MQIYIATDMEGVAGVAMQEQLTKGTAEYAEARHLLTAEVNAAVAGAVAGGATRVVVKDAHATGFNLVPEQLDPRAEYVTGPSQPDRFPGLGAGFAGLLLIGYHAMTGTEGAVCDHTMSTQTWSRCVLCGREVGEAAGAEGEGAGGRQAGGLAGGGGRCGGPAVPARPALPGRADLRAEQHGRRPVLRRTAGGPAGRPDDPLPGRRHYDVIQRTLR